MGLTNSVRVSCAPAQFPIVSNVAITTSFLISVVPFNGFRLFVHPLQCTWGRRKGWTNYHRPGSGSHQEFLQFARIEPLPRQRLQKSTWTPLKRRTKSGTSHFCKRVLYKV